MYDLVPSSVQAYNTFIFIPLSFGEFLDAMNESELRRYILDFSNLKKLPVNLHDKLNEYVRKYFIVGGMPAVVKEYITTRNIIEMSEDSAFNY